MELSWKNFFIYLLVFLVSELAIAFSIIISIGLVGLPEDFNHLTIFISIGLITFYALSKTKNLINSKGVVYTIIIAWFVLFLPKSLNSSLNFTLTAIPFFISFLMAMAGGYTYYKKRSFKLPILMGLFPLILTLGLSSIWNNNIIYGSASGEVQNIKVPDFSIIDNSGSVINNESIHGKIVLMDFWFISCRPCWVKFPELQRIYNQYKSNDQIAIYAVNRPMKKDKPNQLYKSIENKNYTFPVVKGTEELMAAFEIDYYPTVIIVDLKGNIVFKGGIELAEDVIKKLTTN